MNSTSPQRSFQISPSEQPPIHSGPAVIARLNYYPYPGWRPRPLAATTLFPKSCIAAVRATHRLRRLAASRYLIFVRLTCSRRCRHRMKSYQLDSSEEQDTSISTRRPETIANAKRSGANPTRAAATRPLAPMLVLGEPPHSHAKHTHAHTPPPRDTHVHKHRPTTVTHTHTHTHTQTSADAPAGGGLDFDESPSDASSSNPSTAASSESPSDASSRNPPPKKKQKLNHLATKSVSVGEVSSDV